MSTRNKCQPKTNVNQKQMSTKNNCQPKTNVNQSQLPTQLQLNPIQSNFNPGWGYKVTGLNTTTTPPHPTTHPQTFNQLPGIQDNRTQGNHKQMSTSQFG